jgi:hypothetical protein
MTIADTERPSTSCLPSPLRAAIDRVAVAESELGRVYPLFATKLDAQDGSPSGERAALELEAFSAEVRLSHRAAIHALRFWREEQVSAEAAAAAYESLAMLIERFAMRAGLNAYELDSTSMPSVAGASFGSD